MSQGRDEVGGQCFVKVSEDEQPDLCCCVWESVPGNIVNDHSRVEEYQSESTHDLKETHHLLIL